MKFSASMFFTDYSIDDATADGADALDHAFHDVALLHRRHAFGCAGVDQIAGRQFHPTREVGDGFRNAPD